METTNELGVRRAESCGECGGSMDVCTIAQHRDDKLIGMQGVVILDSAKKFTCSVCGEEDILIPNVEGLVAAVASTRAMLPEKLDGRDIRFFRKAIGLTAKALADLLEVREETISRWENAKDAIGASSERLLRFATVVYLRDKAPAISFGADQMKDLLEMRIQPVRSASTPFLMGFELVKVKALRGIKQTAWDKAA